MSNPPVLMRGMISSLLDEPATGAFVDLNQPANTLRCATSATESGVNGRPMMSMMRMTIDSLAKNEQRRSAPASEREAVQYRLQLTPHGVCIIKNVRWN